MENLYVISISKFANLSVCKSTFKCLKLVTNLVYLEDWKNLY